MEKDTYKDAVSIRHQIDECKIKIENMEKFRDVQCVNISDAYSSNGCQVYQRRFTVLMTYNKEDVATEAFQLFLDTLLTLEDKKLVALEKEFEEL